MTHEPIPINWPENPLRLEHAAFLLAYEKAAISAPLSFNLSNLDFWLTLPPFTHFQEWMCKAFAQSSDSLVFKQTLSLEGKGRSRHMYGGSIYAGRHRRTGVADRG